MFYARVFDTSMTSVCFGVFFLTEVCLKHISISNTIMMDTLFHLHISILYTSYSFSCYFYIDCYGCDNHLRAFTKNNLGVCYFNYIFHIFSVVGVTVDIFIIVL